MPAVCLRVGDKMIDSTEITYEDLIILYRQFIDSHGHVPITKECTGENNMPQQRIINRVLKANHVTYKGFLGMFGKKSRARASVSDYMVFVEEFKAYSDKLGRPLTSIELTSDEYNLPNCTWFISYCPDKSVKTYADFVRWCGYEPCKKVWTKEEVADVLLRFEATHGRNVVREDITTPNIGFSMIVINRLFGSLEEMRLECGLRPLKMRIGKQAQYYIDHLTDVVLAYKAATGKPYISWADIESGRYSDVVHNHKTYSKHFSNAGLNLFAHVKSLGCMMNEGGFSNTCVLDSGELIRSTLEYEFTEYLNQRGFVYGVDYRRDIRYRDFVEVDSKIDCDYVISIGDKQVFIEVAGVLDSVDRKNWASSKLRDEKHENYRRTLLTKRRLLESIGAEYHFVFREDIVTGKHKGLIDSLADRCLAGNLSLQAQGVKS